MMPVRTPQMSYAACGAPSCSSRTFYAAVVLLLLAAASCCSAADPAAEAAAESGVSVSSELPLVVADTRAYPVLQTEYADSAMPSPRGTKTALLGTFLMLLFLFLTKWEPREGARDDELLQLQQRAADVIDSPFRALNEKVKDFNFVASSRGFLWKLSVLFLGVSMIELLLSLNRRRKHKKHYPILSRAHTVKKRSILTLLLLCLATYAAFVGRDEQQGAYFGSPDPN